jgi:hypothetical protein
MAVIGAALGLGDSPPQGNYTPETPGRRRDLRQLTAQLADFGFLSPVRVIIPSWHLVAPPIPYTLLLSRRFSRVSSATTSFRALASRRGSVTSSEFAARAVSPASHFFPGLEEVFRPTVIQVLDDSLPPAQFGNALLTAQVLQHDAVGVDACSYELSVVRVLGTGGSLN